MDKKIVDLVFGKESALSAFKSYDFILREKEANFNEEYS